MRQQGARGWREAASSWFNTIQQWYNRLPLFTKACFTFILMVYVLQLTLNHAGTFSLCLRAASVVKLQVWRLLTSVFIHADILHVLLNMLAFVPLGQALEQALGTLQLTHLTALIIGIQGLLYVALSYAMSLSRLYPGAVHTCALGFSGVIFGLLAAENSLVTSAHRSLFGLVAIPTPLYPWVLLLLWQLLIPSASFFGHLAGLLAGLLWASNGLLPLAPLTQSTSVGWEASAALRPWVSHPSFIPTPASLPITSPHLDTNVAHGRGAGPGGPLPAAWAHQDSQGAFANMFGFGRVGQQAAASGPGVTVPSRASDAERGLQQQQQPITGQQGAGGSRLGGDGALPGSSASSESAAARAAAAAAAEARQLKAAAASGSGSGAP